VQETGDLLGPGDPDPVDEVNPQGSAPVLLVCEHAGQTVPAALGDLGITCADLDRHIGWDIGAGAVTGLLAGALDAPAMLQRYSRLVIDCNRPPDAPDAMPEQSDKVVIPGNAALSAQMREARVRAIFDPFHAGIGHRLDTGRFRAALSIHSFTPVFDGVQRPWDIGLLYRHDTDTSERLRAHFQRRYPELNVGMNQPYQVDDMSDWFVPRHGEARGIPHSLIEIRNDHISTPAGQQRWSEILSGAIRHLLYEDAP